MCAAGAPAWIVCCPRSALAAHFRERKKKQKEKAPRKFRDSERECERKRGRSWHHAEELRARMQITLSTTLRESAVRQKENMQKRRHEC